MARRTNGPRSVMSDDAERTSGDDARSMNLSAARAVADAVRTTLGPQGMDKMLVGDSGGVIVTNDGVTLLEEMDIDHPSAGLVVEVARAQEADVGDGTTSAVVLAGELLANAEELLDQGLHPTSIVGGYDHAATAAQDVLTDLAVDLRPGDTETLRAIAETAMTGKGAEAEKGHLADLVVRAVQAATRPDGRVERDAVDIRSFHGGGIDDSRFVHGAMADYDPPNESFAVDREDADVLIYMDDLEISELEVDAEAEVGSFDEVAGFVDREKEELDEAVQRIIDLGADVVLLDGGIEDYAQDRLIREGVLAMRRVRDEEKQIVGAATGARPVGRLEDATRADLGHAGSVTREKIRDYGFSVNSPPERTVVFDDVAGGETGTILLRGSTEHVVEELERAVEDAVDVVAAALEDGTVLPGGGAVEVEVAAALRDEADGVAGREQLAVEAFAEAVEAAPRILAENAGLDSIDAMTALRAAHDGGQRTAGLDAATGETVDAMESGVVEPMRVKATAMAAAVEVASSILRIDDVIGADGLAASGDEDEAGAGGPGAGGPF